MTSSMQHFEACIGGHWLAWEADDNTTIKKQGQRVTIKTVLDSGQLLTNIIDLVLIPSYAFY